MLFRKHIINAGKYSHAFFIAVQFAVRCKRLRSKVDKRESENESVLGKDSYSTRKKSLLFAAGTVCLLYTRGVVVYNPHSAA